jgi:uncharacterized membrane protein
MNPRVFGPLSICLVLAGWLMAALAIPALPPAVPTSFGTDGAVTGTSSPQSLWYLPVLLTVMYVVLTGVLFVPHDRLRVPVQITERNRERVSALAREMALALRVGVLALVLCVEWAIFHVAGHKALDTAFLVAVVVPLVAVFGVTTSFFVRMAKA